MTPRIITICTFVALGISTLLTSCSKSQEESVETFLLFESKTTEAPGITSIDLGKYTIKTVRTATAKDGEYIVAGSFEGTLIGLDFDGTVRWVNPLSGFMNHDVWCADITGDGVDETLAANADGTVYCIGSDGGNLWKYKANEAPVYSVSVIHKDGTPYVVSGGFDCNIHYVDAGGKLVKSIASKTYSKEKPWNWGENIPPSGNDHSINFLRPVKRKDGTEKLAVIGQIAQTTAGSLYEFEPLAEKPFRITKLDSKRTIGDFRVSDIDGDGDEEIFLGSTGMLRDSYVFRISPDASDTQVAMIQDHRKGIDKFGYRVVQPEIIADGDSYQYFVLFGSRILIADPSLNFAKAELLTGKYSYNDMCKDPLSGRIILASSQSGGSCVHIIDTGNNAWKKSYENLNPPGKIQTILDNTAAARKQLENFSRPAYEREPLPVYFLSEKSGSELSKKVITDIQVNHKSPIFLGGTNNSLIEKFDRSSFGNEKYEKRRDKRQKYELTQQQVLDKIIPEYEGQPGIAYWGGHGNDPNFYQVSTTKKVLDAANGKKTVLIFPEVQDPSENFAWLIDFLIRPLADYCQPRNGNLYIRSKYNFWHGDIYLPAWSLLTSGEFKEVFVPALEETSGKAMDQSPGARQGLWASGAVDAWGARCARDNTSFDRTREHSHQMLPNHFLRQMVYNISSGATYIDNFAVDQDYMSFLWELIADGALYVPKREEIVSWSPVHLGMKEPDHDFIEEGASAHWTVFYDEKKEADRPMVFGRMNGSWKGAPVTEWDYSRFASGVKDRRLHFLPPTENGTVLIAPPQHGKFAADNVPRGHMTDHMHPLYKNISKEHITDGKNYYSSDGSETFAADKHYKIVEEDIKKGAEKLPMNVTGGSAWVAAQSAPKHIRLTLIDSGYINPTGSTATVHFHSVTPVKVTDVLTGKEIGQVKGGVLDVEIPLGLFRFLDVELSEELK
ncbi:MAG: hypothetical protein ACSHX9_01825 [Luteolibacter sp.]